MSYYRVSALAYGFARMWRGWAVVIPVVVVNALIQALLVWPDATPMIDALAILLAVLSALVLLIAFGLVASTALHVTDGRVGWSAALGTLRGCALRYALWAIVLGVVMWAGFALYTLPGILVLALTPFLLLAALDGQRNPVAANFRTIGRRFWRWLVTTLIVVVVLLVAAPISGFFTFFTRNPLASLVVWLIGGFVLAWFTTAWALIYRSALGPPGSLEPRTPIT